MNFSEDELKLARAARDKIKSDADAAIFANARKWKDKNDGLKTENIELLEKYEKLKKDNYEFAKKYKKLKSQYEKEHSELKEIKRGQSASLSKAVKEDVKEECDEDINELLIAE